MNEETKESCAHAGSDIIHLKPKCPYYVDTQSNLYCPYFMMASQYPMMGLPQNGYPRWPGTSSLVLGILALVLSWLCFIPYIGFLPFIIVLILSVLSIVFGAFGMRAIPAGMRGRGTAIAGFILGMLGLVLGIVFLILSLILFRPMYATGGM
ncbi:MAG: DUF4190 domain-containing protein [Euryarchaeota archaeon]|nr:DUF4190 domain-containing protein [Euryarchaeota archaeon]